MKSPARTVIASLIMASLVLSPLAEAKRIGGGGSYGMSRSHSSSSSSYGNSSSSNSYAQPVYSQPAQPARKGPGWGGVAAGVAAGAVGGALLANATQSHAAPATAQTENGSGNWTQNPTVAPQEKSGFSWFWLIVLLGVGYFVLRRFMGKKTALAGAPASGPFGYSNSNAAPSNPFPTSGSNTNIFGQPVGTAAPVAGGAFTSNGQTLPDGTEKAAFLRQARSTFLHMQTMNSSSSVEELRRYFTPEMFEAIRGDIANNPDTAEFPSLNAQVVDTAEENGQYVVSVLYSGTVSEDLHSAPVSFQETWHFVKPAGGSPNQQWLVAGIQQN